MKKRADVGDQLANPYETAIELLKVIQLDCRRAIEQLRDVSSYLGQREAAATRQLRIVLDGLERMSGKWGRGTMLGGRGAPTKAGPRRDMLGSLVVAGECAPTLEIYCLGKFRVHVGGARIEQWRRVKAKALLKYLVARRGHPASKDVLMEALWPGCEPPLANNNLKAAARSLRQTLGAAHGSNGDFPWVLFQDGNYTINPEADVWSDADQFEYHWQVARQMETDGRIAEAIKEHQAAEALYHGDYMEDNPYEEWTTLRREALKDVYLAIVSRLADYSMQQEDYEGCGVYCQKILVKDPCREDAYQRLMCCHSRLGQRSRAISWYRLCEKTIKAELDLCPDRRTVALYRKLLNDEYI